MNFTEDNFQLSTCKPFSNTPVSAIPISEGLLRSTLAVQVKGVRVWEDFLVSVAGLGGGDDTFTSFNELYKQLVKHGYRLKLLKTHLVS